jgi:imidazole glycerol-phosphate synthase subunit HisH
MKYISIIDMGINNIRSVVGVINYLGYKTMITRDENKIMESSALILPGVGSFPEGINNLRTNNLDKIIKNFFKKGKPVLAICLGFQMLFTSSEEFGFTKGLNIINGKVKSLKSLKTKQIIPNLGWNIIKYKKDNTNYLFSQLVSKPSVYFIHSYYVETKEKKKITSSINFGGKNITTSIQYKNLYGVQFHPEKSGKNGIKIIKNFLDRIKK